MKKPGQKPSNSMTVMAGLIWPEDKPSRRFAWSAQLGT